MAHAPRGLRRRSLITLPPHLHLPLGRGGHGGASARVGCGLLSLQGAYLGPATAVSRQEASARRVCAEEGRGEVTEKGM